MKRQNRLSALLLALLCCWLPLSAHAEEEIIPPEWEVPDYVTWLLEIAGNEVGYREGAHGYSKYGAWAGDPYAQWCAEYLCWCVDQVDQQHGTELLKNVYPLYSGSNTGRSWFIKQGRYVVRNGHLTDWGYQWLKGTDTYLKTGDYIPQPGDWMFFTWTETQDTDHVAMVEYCTRDADGNVTIHVLEGNGAAEHVSADIQAHSGLRHGTRCGGLDDAHGQQRREGTAAAREAGAGGFIGRVRCRRQLRFCDRRGDSFFSNLDFPPRNRHCRHGDPAVPHQSRRSRLQSKPRQLDCGG